MHAIDKSSSTGGFEEHTADIYGWAYRVLGRHHDALDVVQDVFLRWRAQCEKQTPSQPRGWLRRVTVNRAVDLKRKDRSQRARDTQTVAEVDETATLVGQGADSESLRTDIAIALGQLTDVQRSVLVAKVYDEMTFSKIAAELEVAVSTVKTHYLRAVRVVRNRLRPRWDQELE